MDVSGLNGRASGPGALALGTRAPVPATEPMPPASVGAAFAEPADARSITEPPGLTFTPAGLSPGRTSRFVVDL
ncbi:MAG: hypothetical protein AB7L17_24135 [Ilumatobacteraceae bacterium]